MVKYDCTENHPLFVSDFKIRNVHVYKLVERLRIHNKIRLTFIGMEVKIWIPLLDIQ